MNRGLIVLLPKEGDAKLLLNWRPITLLNTAYKLSTKVLQIRLQLLLPEIIHDSQTAFLPSRFILDSVMVQNETEASTVESQQPLVMLKVNFSKAFDTVSWRFLLKAMRQFGIPSNFITMVNMLLEGASASVALNSACTASFPIRRGVR